MKFEKLTKDNVLMFAIKAYDNPQALGTKEFYDDMKRFKYLKRLFKKYSLSGDLKDRLIINHLIILGNVFGVEAANALLFFKIDKIHLPILKSCLVYLNHLTDSDVPQVKKNEKVYKILKEL